MGNTYLLLVGYKKSDYPDILEDEYESYARDEVDYK